MTQIDGDARLAALRTPDGDFAMVALDQRESMREMLPTGGGGELAGDERLSDFKSAAAAILGPHASGVLLDHPLGAPGPHRPAHLSESTGLLLAADELHSVRGAGVVSSSLDPAVTAELARGVGADALKYLVIWRRGDDSFRDSLEQFHALAGVAGLPTFVEGIVRPAHDGTWASPRDRFDAIQEAALDLARGASVYKAEVPGYRPGELGEVEAESRQLTAAIGIPWVVLSNGVERSDFVGAVAASCAGGAHGFLAGRAIWSDVVAEPDAAAALRSRSVDRVNELRSTVRAAREIGERSLT